MQKITIISPLRAYLFFLFLFFTVNCTFAQYAKGEKILKQGESQNVGTPSKLNKAECAGLARPQLTVTPWLTHIKNIGTRYHFSAEIDALKAEKTANKLNASPLTPLPDTQHTVLSTTNFALGNHFQGNIFNGGAPPDNTLAISNNGYIVSVINCNIAYYTTNGNLLWTGSFWELFNDPTLTEIIYDPHVLYDSQADRFVMVAIHGFTSAKSKLMIAFSKTNNPTDGWWIYKLSGNPLNNACWLDYPSLGVSNNEIYVTGNLFNDLTGFSEAIIYQISKSNGYAGTNLNWITWANIAGSPSTLVPASYGQQGNYGPGIYFVNQSPATGNAVELYELTDDLGMNPQLTRNTIFKSDYAPSGYALQAGTSVQLITGDCRILKAFYLNGIIHYVFQSEYQSSNYTGINYNRLNVNTLTNLSYTYGQIGFDYAYPSVASFATSPTDKSVVICFLKSGASIFPETQAVIFDNAQTWSSPILIKSGDNYVDAFEVDNTVRWGDYTGIACKYNAASPEAWVSGCFGSTQNVFGTNYNCFNTWIGQVTSPTLSTVSLATETPPALTVYPNPAIDLFTLDFELPQISQVSINLYDLSGKNIHRLFNGTLKKGKNLLTFNKNALVEGTYFVNVVTDNRLVITKKLVVH